MCVCVHVCMSTPQSPWVLFSLFHLHSPPLHSSHLIFYFCTPFRSGDAHHRPSSSSSSSSSSSNGSVMSLLPILRDPLLLDLLITAFIHPSKQLPSPAHNHTAKLLAVICGSYYEENPELGTILYRNDTTKD